MVLFVTKSAMFFRIRLISFRSTSFLKSCIANEDKDSAIKIFIDISVKEKNLIETTFKMDKQEHMQRGQNEACHNFHQLKVLAALTARQL